MPLIRAFCAVHKVAFKQGFGMTEFGPGAFSLAPEFGEAKAGSIGRFNYFVDARIVDEDNVPVKDGEVGELCSRARPPARATSASTPRTSTRRGFVTPATQSPRRRRASATSSIRKKDMFISGGENVYPVEIEKITLRAPGGGPAAP